MKLKLWVSCLAVVSLVAVSASAQESAPKVDVFAGYSYLQANPVVTGVDSFHLLGGNASAAYNITSWLSGVADFGGYTNGNILNTHTSGTFSTYLFGPRVSYRHYSRRSEERRVGKESRFGGGTQHEETRGGENEDR